MHMRDKFVRFALTGAALVAAPFALADDDEEPQPTTIWEYLTGKYDADEDGRITREEYTRDDLHWARLDKDADGVLLEEEVGGRARGGRARGGGGRGGGGRGGGRGGRDGEGRRPDPPRVGEVAPDFELELLPPPRDELLHRLDEEQDEEQEEEAERARLQLSSFRGEKPVALIFGSYT